MHTKRERRNILDGAATLFKAIIGNLDPSDGEYFTSSIKKFNQLIYE